MLFFRSKIAKRLYVSLDDVFFDCMLMLNNCITYNEPDSSVSGSALRIREFLQRGYPELFENYNIATTTNTTTITTTNNNTAAVDVVGDNNNNNND